jgi:signal transduction histidine kinase
MNISWSNPIAREWLGSNPVGKKCFEAFDLGDQQCEACDVQKCFEKGLNDEHELELIRPDGARMNLWCTASVATWSEGGVPKSVIVVYRDITEKKLLQAETARAGQLASIGELAAGVAHEINNPINGIINCAQMLIDEDDATSERTEISKRIMKAGDRIAMIVRNLLSFARNNEEEPNLVHVQSILSDSLDLTEVQIRKDGIDLRVDIPPGIPRIKVRGHQIQQVFLNIISNARYALNQEFSQTHESKVIEIKGDTVDANGKQYVRLIFFDRGTGISGDILGKICDPFFSNKPLGEGTGLGLSISQAIIKDHGGNLYFDSVEGEYTRVIIDLPVAPEKHGE